MFMSDPVNSLPFMLFGRDADDGKLLDGDKVWNLGAILESGLFSALSLDSRAPGTAVKGHTKPHHFEENTPMTIIAPVVHNCQH